MRWISPLSLIVLLCGIPLSARAAEGDKELAEKAYGFFKKYCAACHHGEKPKSEVEDYDVLDYSSLTKKREDGFYVKPSVKGEEALKQSELWGRAGKKGVAGAESDMPPEKFKKKAVKPIPTDEERVNILQKWLEAGAPRWSAKPAEKPATPPKKPATPDEAACAGDPKPPLTADGKPTPPPKRHRLSLRVDFSALCGKRVSVLKLNHQR